MERLQQELDELRQELARLREQNQALAERQHQQEAGLQAAAAAQLQAAALAQQQAAQLQQVAAAQSLAGAAPAGGASPPNPALWGYGEIYYARPTRQSELTRMDLARAVFGIGYRFDEGTVFNSEYEVEHAVASADDSGEFEVEQFYVDHQLSDSAAAKFGLFLMPFGLLNEHHEPEAFHGVQRNFVETLVIPSTWREGGVALHGTTAGGLRWDGGLTTGFNLSGWDPNPADPQYRSALELINSGVAPLQASHQELQLANAQHLSQYLSLGYNGTPGLSAGVAAFTGLAALPATLAGLPEPRITLWETHGRWTPGRFDLSALYARGTLSSTAAYNLANPGAANPLPARFEGGYLQAAWNLWQDEGMRVSPFARWEYYELGAAYQGLAPGSAATPAGLAGDGQPWPQPHDRVWTAGANLYLNPHLVLKADYQHFDVNSDFARVDLGLGLSF